MMITITIPDEIDELVEVVKKKEFPSSYFAAHVVSQWMYDQVEAVGEDDPENSVMANAIGRKIGLSYREMLSIGEEVKLAEFNRCMLLSANNHMRLFQAFCMVYGQRFSESPAVICDWREWEDFDQDDCVLLPLARFPLDTIPGKKIPFILLELIVHHAKYSSKPLSEVLASFVDDVRQYFTNHQYLFVIPADEIEGISLNFLSPPD